MKDEKNYLDDLDLEFDEDSDSETFDSDTPAEEAEYVPTNAEIMAQLKKNQQLMVLLLVVTTITIVALIGVSIYLYQTVISYKSEIDEAFETMKKIDTMVSNLETDYTTYTKKIDEFFKTIDDLKVHIDNFNNLMGSLPTIRLPF
ncbi:hypothetical protein [Oribacterium sp. WCC10]|uniref:hypothetical protein n=1 Tax=Oribacterium sp. WCC10 TaxID=1855343 RepID=UPI0008E8F2C4|nr:hypothetical protein [Oribacterium sp. WCC10]SFG81481.1 hypothetical protein SAMN05216356_1355 [Oribacterium sp. WCC10]